MKDKMLASSLSNVINIYFNNLLANNIKANFEYLIKILNNHIKYSEEYLNFLSVSYMI